MKKHKLLTLAFCISFAITTFHTNAQKVGINTDTPIAELDIRGEDDTNDGGELQLSTPNQTNFLRFFGGRLGDRNPFIAFHDQDTFHLVRTSADYSTFRQLMSVLPNGQIGIGTKTPQADLDINTLDADDGAAIHLSNSDDTNFLRLYSGRAGLPNPFIYWNLGSHLEFGRSDADESNYETFLTLDGKTMGIFNTGRSIFIGEEAGSADDKSDNSNIGVGSFAIQNNVSGELNIAIGDSSLYTIDNDNRNIAIGHSTLRLLTSGFGNVGIGDEAGRELLSGSNNTFIGRQAGRNAVNISKNTAIGNSAGHFLSDGDDNVMIGYFAGYGILEGDRNVYIGSAAATNITGDQGGEENVIIGASAGIDGPGIRNTYLGARAGLGNNGGIHNVILGFNAGASPDTLNNTVLIGYEAGFGSNRDNTLMIDNSSTASPLIYGEFDNDLLRVNGKQEISGELDIDKTGVALRINGDETIWYNDTYLSYGFGAEHNYFAKPMRVGPIEGSTTPFADLHVVDSGLSNLVIESHTGDAKLQLSGNTNSQGTGWTMERDGSSGDLQFRHNNLLKMTMDNSGNLGIGVANPINLVDIAGVTNIETAINGTNNYITYIGNTSDNNSFHNDGLQITAGHTTYNSSRQSNFIRFENPSGAQTGRIGQISSSSVTYQVSSDIRLKKDITPTQYGLKEILKIQPKDFYWKNDLGTSPKYTGFIAQELYDVFPQAASIGGDDPESNPWSIAPMELIPLLVKGMQELQEQIDELKKQNEILMESLTKE